MSADFTFLVVGISAGAALYQMHKRSDVLKSQDEEECMMNKKIIFALIFSILIVGLFMGNVNAKDNIETDVVTGNVYTCYFYTPLEVFNAQVTFGSNNALTVSSFSGFGFYLPLGDLFTVGYYASQASIGQQTGDIVMLLAGAGFDQFVGGTGTILLQYSEVYFVAFGGFQAV